MEEGMQHNPLKIKVANSKSSSARAVVCSKNSNIYSGPSIIRTSIFQVTKIVIFMGFSCALNRTCLLYYTNLHSKSLIQIIHLSGLAFPRF